MAVIRELREMTSFLMSTPAQTAPACPSGVSIFTGLVHCGEHKYWCGPR